MRGLRAPARTASPTPEVPSSMRVAGTMLPCLASWSMPSAVRMTTSARWPSAMDFSSACVAWYSTFRPGMVSCSTPFRASVLRIARSSKSGFDGDIDVVGASVHVAEELGLAELARAMRDADADISIARNTHIEARIQVIEELPRAAVAPGLVMVLHLADLLRVGKPRAEAESRVQIAAPGKFRPV